MFSRVKKYGMNLLVTNDKKLLDFLTPLLDQIEGYFEGMLIIPIYAMFRTLDSKATQTFGPRYHQCGNE